jgi:hypothetical protein
MVLKTRLIEIEIHAGFAYLRVGALDMALARGQGWSFGKRASWLS